VKRTGLSTSKICLMKFLYCRRIIKKTNGNKNRTEV